MVKKSWNLKFHFLDPQFFLNTGIQFYHVLKIQVGDLLITITGANVTKTAFIGTNIGEAYVSQHVALARPGSQTFPRKSSAFSGVLAIRVSS